MKKNLLFVTTVSLSLVFSSFCARAADVVVGGGLVGIITGKIYDAIFGGTEHKDSSGVKNEFKEKNKEEKDSVVFNK